MKILHITFHHGCEMNINFVAKRLGYDITTQFADCGYNIGHDRAEALWNTYKDFYNQFDVIITSDTAPLARIFLQNGYKGKLIIWVCNRFDYCDVATLDCEFPDQEYYDLFREATRAPNIKIYSYTKFEHEYADKFRNIQWSDMIKPCAFVDDDVGISGSPQNTPDRTDMFFIPPYHNDTVCVNLKAKCDELGIAAYNGAYNGPLDLKGVRGIIHIPYAWSNLALFENWFLGNVYFIPTPRFLFQLQTEGHFFWSPPFPPQYVRSSEWYLPEHQELFGYFDSWNELKRLTSDVILIEDKKKKVLEFSNIHTLSMLNKWKIAIENW